MNQKMVGWIAAVFLFFSSVSIQAQRVIEVFGTYGGTSVRLANEEIFDVRPGETRFFHSDLPATLSTRAESLGWQKRTVNPEWDIKISFRELDPTKPERLFCIAALIGKRNRNGKVLLFSPELFERTYPGRPPIYYLSSVLRSKGFDVLTVDVDIVGRKKFIKLLRDFKPDIIGGTSLSVQINEAMSLMELAKRECPRVITILGGNHATAAGEYLYPIHASYLDAVVVGEGLTTIEFIAGAVKGRKWDSVRNEIPGLLQWDGNRIIRNKPALAEDPNKFSPDFPYHPTYNFPIFNLDNGTPRKTFQAMTAFGCQNACFFCFSSTNLRGEATRVERRMSLSSVEAILRRASEQGYEAVYIDDDTFTRDREHALEVTRLCKKYNLIFGCHTRPDCEDESLIREFAANGCRYMFSGFETIVPEILKGANKTHDPIGYRDAYLRSYRLKNETGILVSAYLIHGMPRVVNDNRVRYEIDTLEDSRASIEFAVRELNPTYLSMNVLRFLPDVPFSFARQFDFLRPISGPLHGGYWDKKWLEANDKKDPRCFHPILRAFEGSGSAIPVHMTPERCYKILQNAVEIVNRKNAEAGRNQTIIVVDPWFEERFLHADYSGGIRTHYLAPFETIEMTKSI
ncbi:MAG: cobalamin B12-binding domain-containing protein [Candidatus Sungbacteria bacterium]|nr:cobalamin B12-binding domain-containing protein [Candidatus Sungbacteria bacterium]